MQTAPIPTPSTAPRAPLRIGMTARLMHKPPAELGFRDKKLQYIEQSVAHWIMSEGALAMMIPTLAATDGLHRSEIKVSDYVRAIDGLVLQGGADVCPISYGEEPLHQDWSGDRARDLYELDLVWECIIQKKPIFGICRGCQLLNVAFGGTLYQDIPTQREDAQAHVDHAIYDQHTHSVFFNEDSLLRRLYPNTDQPDVISIHHQAVKDLGAGLVVEAQSVADNLVEAIRGTGNSFVYGVQWHPEFHRPQASTLLNSAPLLGEFLRSAAQQRYSQS